MKTIFAFGDSYTYGHGLEDCWVKQGHDYRVGPMHSQYSWPSLLAKDLVYDLKNYSNPGSSNLAILHKILNTNFDKDSICIVMWSYPNRDMIFNKDYVPNKELFVKKTDTINNIIHVGNWIESELSKIWMLTHNDTDLIMRSWYHIHHANLYLASLKIPHYNLFVHYPMLKDYHPAYVKIPFKDIKVDHFIDKALDGNHPGPMTQQRIAKDIKECLFEDSII
jgi:lysophospholipase L1-like esterase